MKIIYDSFESLDTCFGIDGNALPHCDIDISGEVVRRGTSPAKQYWAQFTQEERREYMARLATMRKSTGGLPPGFRHSETTKAKMSKSATGKTRPGIHKGGALIKDGVVVPFTCLTHFCKENKLSSGHVCELLQGKRKSVKGWKLWEL